MRAWDDDGELLGDLLPGEPACLEVEITDPIILGQLLGPNGEPIATLLDRRPVPFGFVAP